MTDTYVSPARNNQGLTRRDWLQLPSQTRHINSGRTVHFHVKSFSGEVHRTFSPEFPHSCARLISPAAATRLGLAVNRLRGIAGAALHKLAWSYPPPAARNASPGLPRRACKLSSRCGRLFTRFKARHVIVRGLDRLCEARHVNIC